MKKLSVIIPIYNAEKYLHRSIESVLAQSFGDMEVLLIDDGSDDGSVDICREYEKRDRRVRLILKENSGVVATRKRGLMEAAGEFVGWVDADDWIEEGYYQSLLSEQKKCDADVVTSGHFHEIGTGTSKIFDAFLPGSYTINQIASRLLYSGDFFSYGIQPHLWNKIFKRSILVDAYENVNDRIGVGDDAAVVYPAFLKCEKIIVTDLCMYHYIQHTESLTSKNEDVLWSFQEVWSHLEINFSKSKYAQALLPQLSKYKKYCLLLRKIDALDKKVLYPFGGISPDSRVVLYGAGALGRTLYEYIKSIPALRLVAWIDLAYETYRKRGMPVDSPKDIAAYRDSLDYILIANTIKKTADNIRNDLITQGISNDKILWISEEFIEGAEL